MVLATNNVVYTAIAASYHSYRLLLRNSCQVHKATQVLGGDKALAGRYGWLNFFLMRAIFMAASLAFSHFLAVPLIRWASMASFVPLIFPAALQAANLILALIMKVYLNACIFLTVMEALFSGASLRV
jgi:hypothetical protein